MRTLPVLIPFKGSRDYVWGPDMFNVMMAAARVGRGAASHIRYSIHRQLRRCNALVLVTDEERELPAPADSINRLSCVFDGRTVFMGLIPAEGEPETQRVPFEEALVTGRCNLQGTRVTFDTESPFTFLETIVAMHKRLLKEVLPEPPARWSFTKLELDTECDARRDLALEFSRNIGFRLAKSRVFVAGKPVGAVYFSAERA